MRCQYCSEVVFGDKGTTVIGIGSAHKACLESELALSRIFKGLDVSSLNKAELADLKELVLTEENARERTAKGEEVELF